MQTREAYWKERRMLQKQGVIFINNRKVEAKKEEKEERIEKTFSDYFPDYMLILFIFMLLGAFIFLKFIFVGDGVSTLSSDRFLVDSEYFDVVDVLK